MSPERKPHGHDRYPLGVRSHTLFLLLLTLAAGALLLPHLLGGDAAPPGDTRVSETRAAVPAALDPACDPPLRRLVSGRTHFCVSNGEGGPTSRSVTYYDSSWNQRASAGEHRDGHREGRWREWFPSGALRSELDFRAGEPHGEWQEWFEGGSARSEGQYESGEETGRWSFWFEGGGLSERGEMYQGDRDGAWTAWHPNGRARYRRHYARGALQAWQEWDPQGDPVGASDQDR